MRADDSRERQTPNSAPDDEMRQAPDPNSSNEMRQAPPSPSDTERQQVQPVRDAQYEEYLEWRRQRTRPFYSKGWFWALFGLAGLALIAWQLGNITEAVQTTAEATRDQTSALEEQTQVLRETGGWMVQQLQDIKEVIVELAYQVRDAIQEFRSSSNTG